MSDRRVLCASTAGPGGPALFVRAMQQAPLWTDWNVRHIATHRVDSGQTMKVVVFARGTALFAAALIRSRPYLVHLHTVGKTGSFSRNAILAWMSRLARVPVILHVHASTFDAFYKSSPPPVRSLIRATLSRVDAVATLDEGPAINMRAMAPHARVVVVPDATQLDALYREVSR